MRRRTAAVLCCVGLLLTGCARSPQARLNQAVSDVSNQANRGNSAGLVAAVDRLLSVLSDPTDLPAERVAQARALAAKIQAEAGLLDAPPSPPATASPSPSPTPSHTPSPSPTTSPTPTPTPTRTPTPTPSRTPSPTPSRTPSPSPTPTRTPSPTPTSPAATPTTPSPTTPSPTITTPG